MLRTLLSALERSARVLSPDRAAGVVGAEVGAEGSVTGEGLQGRGFSEGQCSCSRSSALARAWRADGALAVQEGGSAGDTRCHSGGSSKAQPWPQRLPVGTGPREALGRRQPNIDSLHPHRPCQGPGHG